MSLSLACPCGARFEVEETFAGQSVGCPDCHRPVKASARTQGPVYTSGYAIASVVSAFVLALTVVGTALAVVLGLVALVSISRNRDRVTGAGYAVFGIVAGLLFTVIALLAYSKAELFDEARQTLLLGKVDRSGPLEVVREKDGFAITRPSQKWGVAGARAIKNAKSDSRVLLVHGGKDAYLDVGVEQVGALGIEQCRDQMVEGIRHEAGNGVLGEQPGIRRTDFHLRESRRLPPLGNAAVAEVLFDVRVMGQPVTFLIRLFKDEQTGRLFLVRGWVHRRRFGDVEADFRKAMDSFRLLARRG
jgi:hypothetical protein